MNESLVSALILLAAAGGFAVGYMLGFRRELYWRIKWIELEHDCARAEGRQPRNINTITSPTKTDLQSHRCTPDLDKFIDGPLPPPEIYQVDQDSPPGVVRLWWMHGNHTFVKLRNTSLEDTLAQVRECWEKDPHGMLCGYQPAPNGDCLPGQVHGHGRDKREIFETEARAWLSQYLSNTAHE